MASPESETASNGSLAARLVSFGHDNWIFLLAFACIAGLRLYHCLQLTSNTGDAVRHLCWGLIVNQHGYAAIGQSLVDFSDKLDFVVWKNLPYNYPVVTLAFDQLCALVSPTVFFVKLMLTLLELSNSLLIYRLTRQRLLAFVYWASPVSIWWVSHEGQFEPLQSAFVLLALLLFSRGGRKTLAWLVLGLGVQVKLSAIFLLPFLFGRSGSLRAALRGGAAFCLAFVPSLLLLWVVNPFGLLSHSLALQYNPYYFNFFDGGMFAWNPSWLIASNQVTSYGFLAILIWAGATGRRRWIELMPAIGFILFLKTIPNAQFWYLLALPPFLLTITDVRLRNGLFLALPLLDIRALMQVVIGPFGWAMPGYYDRFTEGVFTNVGSLL